MHAQMGKLMSFEEYYIWKKPVFYKMKLLYKMGGRRDYILDNQNRVWLYYNS